jgi:hypothetical protein
LSNASLPNTPTAAAPPSLSWTSVPETRDKRHLTVVVIFFVFGIASLLPVIYLTNRMHERDQANLKAGLYAPATLLDYALVSPSTFFALAVVLAGIFVWRLDLLPRGLRVEPWRAAGGAFIAFLIYPLGLIFLLAEVFGIGGLLEAMSGKSSPQSDAGELFRFFYIVALLCAAGMVAVLLAGTAIALATHFWPRRVLLWGLGISALAVFSTATISVIRQNMRFPGDTAWSILKTSMFDTMFFSLAWNIEIPILIGQPLLAALLGHWLCLAARRYASSPA